MTNPHDALVKAVFGQPRHAAGLLRHVLPARLVQAIDWRSLETCPGSVVDPELREWHADLLFSVRLAGRRAFVYVLIEHKSWSDAWTALQLLGYLARIWQRFHAENPRAARLPPIVPVVVHHGERAWAASADFASLLDVAPELCAELLPYQVQFRFRLDDLTEESEAALFGRAMSLLGRLALFYLSRARESGDFLGELSRRVGALRALLSSRGGAEALGFLVSYLLEATELSRDDVRRFFALHVGPRAEGLVMSTAERIRREERANILLKQLALRFGELPGEVVDRVRSAGPDELDRWIERVLVASTLDELLR